MSYDHLHRLLAHFGDSPRKDTDKVSYSATLNAVQRWLQLGLIDTPQKILRGYTTHVWLSRRGLHQLELPYAYYVPKPSRIPHFYAVNAVRYHLQRFNFSALWESERTLKLQHDRSPLPEATRRRTLPDAVLHVANVPTIAVQVLEQQKLDTSYKIQDAIHNLSIIAREYTRLWCFVPFEMLPTLQQMVNSTKGKEYRVTEAMMKEKA